MSMPRYNDITVWNSSIKCSDEEWNRIFHPEKKKMIVVDDTEEENLVQPEEIKRRIDYWMKETKL